MIEKTIELTKKDMSDKKIRLVQFTNAISVKFRIADWEIPSGATARIYVKKKSGKEVFNDCLIDGDTNSIIFGTTTQMTAETGKNMAQIQIVSGNTTAASFGFLLEVSENIIEQTAVQSKDEYGVLQGLIKEARDAINGIQPVNNLIGTDPNRPLAAPMGKTLNDKITALNADLENAPTLTYRKYIDKATTLSVQLPRYLFYFIVIRQENKTEIASNFIGYIMSEETSAVIPIVDSNMFSVIPKDNGYIDITTRLNWCDIMIITMGRLRGGSFPV